MVTVQEELQNILRKIAPDVIALKKRQCEECLATKNCPFKYWMFKHLDSLNPDDVEAIIQLLRNIYNEVQIIMPAG